MQKWFQLESNTYIFENGKYLKSIADTSIIVHYEIINGTDTLSIKVNNIVSTTMLNTISINVTSTAAIYFHDKNLRYEMDCHILHTLF